MFIIADVNNDKFLHFHVKIWRGEVEEMGGGGVETVTTSQGFNERQLAIP